MNAVIHESAVTGKPGGGEWKLSETINGLIFGSPVDNTPSIDADAAGDGGVGVGASDGLNDTSDECECFDDDELQRLLHPSKILKS